MARLEIEGSGFSGVEDAQMGYGVAERVCESDKIHPSALEWVVLPDNIVRDWVAGVQREITGAAASRRGFNKTPT